MTNFILKLLLFTVFYTSSLFADKGDIEKITLQLDWKHQFEFAGFYMAKEKGFYKDVGLEVKIKEAKGNTNVIKEVTQNRATYGVIYPSIVLEKSKGQKVVLLSAILQSSPHVLISLQSSGIKSIKDFKNKRIMIVDDNVQTAPFESMLHSHHISVKDMKVLPQSFKLQDLIDKKADIASAFSTNELYQLDKLKIPYNVWDPKEYGFNFYDDILFTSQNEVDNHLQRVNNFNKASLKGWKYAFNHIEETVNLILKKYNTQHKTKEALLYEANSLKKLAYFNTKKIGKITKENIQRIYDTYNLMGLTKHKINLDKFIYKPIEKLHTLTQDEKKYLKKHKIIKMCNNQKVEPLEFAYNGDQNDMRGISIDIL